MKRVIYLSIPCLLGILLLAATCSASVCDPKETVIFFGNGIQSLKKDAYDAETIIKKHLQAQLSQEDFEVLEFDVAYNATHGLPLDLLESTVQLLTGNISRFWRMFWGLEIMPDWFADKMVLLATGLDMSNLVTTDSLKSHVTTYRTKIAEGKKVLLVAHSQGNLFGNLSYSLLNNLQRQSFGMVSVASVDSNVLGTDGPYTTLKSDKIIAALIAAQIVLPSRPMAPNTENLAAAADDVLGHAFIQSYMAAGSNSDRKILGDIISVLAGLAKPPQIVKPGIITVSLTWGAEPDMDLHVYEPNGTQVFWYNMQGYSGALDRDDRSGYGPEHYSVSSCETLEQGDYGIGLDYFKGDEPETATLQIEAGLLVRTFEIPMPGEGYGSANYPVPVANILSQVSENGGYEFKIYR